MPVQCTVSPRLMTRGVVPLGLNVRPGPTLIVQVAADAENATSQYKPKPAIDTERAMRLDEILEPIILLRSLFIALHGQRHA